jgi:hypothetical protein
MKIATQIKLGIAFACFPIAANAGIYRCTAADGNSYITHGACKNPHDVRESVTPTKAIAPVRPVDPQERIVVFNPRLEGEIERDIRNYWRPCKIVQPTRLKIISNSDKYVRYSYALRVLSDGSGVKPADCPSANLSMLQMLAKEDLHKLKAGVDVEVTQEQAVR